MNNIHCFYYIGLYRENLDGIELACVAVHPQKKAVVASYSDGEIRLFRYPFQIQSQQQIVPSYKYLGSVGSVARQMTFSSDGKHLLVVDSVTRTILKFIISIS